MILDGRLGKKGLDIGQNEPAFDIPKAASVSLGDLRRNISDTPVPEDLKKRIGQMIDQLEMIKASDGFLTELQRVIRYTDWIISLPWQSYTDDILDLKRARKVLEESHYGLEQIKKRILEYLSVLILQKSRNEEVDKANLGRAPILCFVGLVGTGKTTIARSIAQSLGRKFIRIPLGGLGDPFYLRGRSYLYPQSQPGQIIRELRRVGSGNPVILLDEIDRVANEALNTIMGVLVELLDPEQNQRFEDHFLDYPFDLSRVLFIATANNTRRVATAVLDRIEPIQMPSYSDREKIIIGQRYIFPKILRSSGLKPEELRIADDTWPMIVRPLGFDAGVRTLARTIEGIVRKTALLIVEGSQKNIEVNKENIKSFLPTW